MWLSSGCGSAVAADLAVLHLNAGGDEAHLASLTRNQRRTIRQDRARMSHTSLRLRTMQATHAVGLAAELIVNIKRMNSVLDHPKLVDFRLSEWSQQAPGQRLAFTVSDSTKLLAVSFASLHDRCLSIYETGLTDDDHPLRHDAYLQSLIHGPSTTPKRPAHQPSN